MSAILQVGERERKQLEGFERARDFFGDTSKRHRDRLILEKSIWSEEYSRGRMALILDCDFPTIGISQPDSARFLHSVATVTDRPTFIVLKADVYNCHKLQSWDEKLMLVTNVHLVQGPEGVIPSLVGFYRIHNEGPKFGSNLLLFQGAIAPTVYKSFACIADWEISPMCNPPSASPDDLTEHEIESASEVMQGIASRKSDFIGRKQIVSKVNAKEILASLHVVINSRSVTVGMSPECQAKFVNIRDVFVGPLNLFV